MTAVLGNLCTLLISEVFGDTVAEVSNELHDWNGRTLPQILSSGKPRVREALAILIHHNIVTFAESERSGRAEYAILHDKVTAKSLV